MPCRNCPLCGGQAAIVPFEEHPRSTPNRRGIACKTCGKYFISVQAENSLLMGASLDAHASERAQLSWVTRERAEGGSPITILLETRDAATGEANAASIGQILDTMVPRSYQERIDRALQNLCLKAPGLADSVRLDPATDSPLLFAENPAAMRLILKHMVQSGLLDATAPFHDGGGDYTPTMAGRQKIDELKSAALALPPTEPDAKALLSALNVEWKKAHGFPLFKLASFEALDSLGGQCQNREDYHTRVLALAELMENLNESAMREVLPADRASSISPGHTLTVLEAYVVFLGYPNGGEAVTALRRAQRLRNLPPTHSADKGGARAIEELKALGFSYPVPAQDWPRVWEATLDLFSGGLQLLRVGVGEWGARGASPATPRRNESMPRKRQTDKPHIATQSSHVTGKGGPSERVTSDQQASGPSARRRVFGWLLALLAAVVTAVLVALVVPPIRHLVMPPKLDWIQIGDSVRKSYWISYNLVDPATGSSSEIVRVDTPVYMLPVRLRARGGTLDVESCQFTQGDPSSNHLRGTTAFYRMEGDAVSEEELDDVLQALLAHDLNDRNDARGRLKVKADMPDMQQHLERYRTLQHQIAAIPVTLRQDEPTPFLLVCVPRLYTGDRDYFADLKDLPAEAQMDLYSRQQERLRSLGKKDFTFSLTTNYGRVRSLRGQIEREE